MDFGFFDDYFIKVFIGSYVYEVVSVRVPLYVFLIVLYLLYLYRKYKRRQAKQRVNDLELKDD